MKVSLPAKPATRSTTTNGRQKSRKPKGDNGRTGFHKISLDAIDMHPRQARQKFPEEEISSLATSLETHGLIEPILVRPLPNGRYELVAGERRYRAATMAGWTEIPATVRDLDDKASLEMMMAENVHRRDLDPIELARGLAQLCRDVKMGGGGLSRPECDEMFGKGSSWTARHLSLLKLPVIWQQKVRNKEISKSVAIALVPFVDQPKVMQAIGGDMKKNPWAWRTLAEVSRSARLISERLQKEADRRAAKAAKEVSDPSESTTVDTLAPSASPDRPRVKNVRKQPASYRDEIRRLLFHVRTAVGDWPEGELPALCNALHALGDDLAESVESKGGAK